MSVRGLITVLSSIKFRYYIQFQLIEPAVLPWQYNAMRSCKSGGQRKHRHRVISVAIMIPLSAACDNDDTNCRAQGLQLHMCGFMRQSDNQDIKDLLRSVQQKGNQLSMTD